MLARFHNIQGLIFAEERFERPIKHKLLHEEWGVIRHTAGPKEAHNIGVPCRLHKLNLQAGTRWRQDMDSRSRRWIRGVGGVAKPVNEGSSSADCEVLVLHSASLSAVRAAASAAVQRACLPFIHPPHAQTPPAQTRPSPAAFSSSPTIARRRQRDRWPGESIQRYAATNQRWHIGPAWHVTRCEAHVTYLDGDFNVPPLGAPDFPVSARQLSASIFAAIPTLRQPKNEGAVYNDRVIVKVR